MTHFVAAILAGGASSRFGADKAMVEIGGAPMIAHVARALGGAGLAVVGHPHAAAALGAVSLRDPPGAVAGPLAGVLAALEWAEAAPWLVTAPCDAPLLPHDLAARLIAAAERSGAEVAYACTSDGPHALCAAWRPALAATLRRHFAGGVHPPAREIVPDAARVMFEARDAFLNVNTKEDLDRASSDALFRPLQGKERV
jgi:molybdenum cofactor guanylyltransferase